MLNYLLNYFPSRTSNWQNLFLITDRLPVVFEGRPHTSDQQTCTSKIWLTSTESKLVSSRREPKGCSCCQVQPSWKGLETISSIDHWYRSRFEKSSPVVAWKARHVLFFYRVIYFSVVKYRGLGTVAPAILLQNHWYGGFISSWFLYQKACLLCISSTAQLLA